MAPGHLSEFDETGLRRLSFEGYDATRNGSADQASIGERSPSLVDTVRAGWLRTIRKTRFNQVANPAARSFPPGLTAGLFVG